MSDLTPPKFWKTQGQADYWLGRFIGEVEEGRPVGNAKFFRLSALIFDTVRKGWETRVVLKKEFADNPDALAEFIRYEYKPRWAHEGYRRMREKMEEGDWE